MKFSILIVPILLLLPVRLSAQCGSNADRWPAKILSDGSTLHLTATHTSVRSMVNLSRPTGGWGNHSRYPNECQKIWLTGDVVMAGEEANDHDYHLVLVNNGDSLIIEIPSPNDCHEITKYKSQYLAARANADQMFSALTGQSVQQATHHHVKVTGFRFFDKIGHGKGHSKNGIEVHPVLKTEQLD